MKRLFISLIVVLPILSQCTELDEKVTKLGRIETLNQYYHQTDGVLVFPAVEMLYHELELNPIEWYEAMAQDSAAFDRFIKDLGSAVFVARDSCRTIDFLESLRTQDIEMLKSLEVPKEYLNIHKRLLDRLKVIRPRAIQ